MGEELLFQQEQQKFLYLRYLMAIKAFHRTGVAKESRGSSLMKSCHRQEGEMFQKGSREFPFSKDAAATSLDPWVPSGRNTAKSCSLGLASFTHF